VLLRNTGTPAAPVFVREAFAPLADITVTWVPAPALADIDGDGELTITSDPPPAGVRYFTGLRTGPLNYVEWTVAHFGEPPPPWGSNFQALPEADPDGDGHQNLVEFAVDTSPTTPCSPPCQPEEKRATR
jgi:hypothetical protein